MKLSELAAKARRDPWTLTGDDGTVIVSVPAPTVDVLEAITSAVTWVDVMKLVAGDQYGPLMEAIGGSDALAVQLVAEDMRAHFGLGN